MYYALILVAALLFSACNSPSPQTPAAPVEPAVDPSTAASITGHVAFDGTPPPAEVIRMDGDPKCVSAAQGEERRTEYFVSDDGKSLGNVFIYVKEGLPQRMYPIPTTPVVFD